MDLQNLFIKVVYSLELKKKYPFGFVILLGLLSMLLFSTSSVCYASTTLTDDEGQYLWNYMCTPFYSGDVFGGYRRNFLKESGYSASQIDKSSLTDSFINFFNNNNDLDISQKTWFFSVHTSINTIKIYYFNFNNTMSNDLPYLALNFSNFNWQFKKINICALDDNKNSVSHTGRVIVINGNNFSYENATLGSAGFTLFFDYNDTRWQNESNVLNPIAGLTNFCKLPLSVVYSNYDGSSYYSTLQSFFYKTLYEFPTSDQSSGDSSGDFSGTGTITNTSGDITGAIDLTGIENSLDNLNNTSNDIKNNTDTIIENQQNNTTAIINNQNSNTTQITNTLTQQPNLNNTNISSGDIERSFRF